MNLLKNAKNGQNGQNSIESTLLSHSLIVKGFKGGKNMKKNILLTESHKMIQSKIEIKILKFCGKFTLSRSLSLFKQE